MPSTRDPNDVVNPGPGKVPAGTVSASALLFVPGGGGGGGLAALLAHITDPTDAHMAGAIGIPAVDPVTGEPLLASAGGPIDGESVLDFLAAVKDLYPLYPDRLGFNAPGTPNNGQPTWTTLVEGGAFARGATVVPTHHVYPAGQTTLTCGGILAPADRGVLAIYRNTTDGNYYNPGTTTLVGALWLGSNPAPAGIPSAAFVEASRPGQQVDHVASLVGLDVINLSIRLPYLKDYSGYAGVYANYADNFLRYQLGTFSFNRPLILGAAGSFLLVHWKSSFATSLAAIQAVNLTALTLVAANVYSALPSPTATDFDAGDIYTINRHNTYRDAQSAVVPALASWATSVNGSPATTFLSGVVHYSGPGLSWTVDIRADNLFADSFYLGSVLVPTPNIPAGFNTTYPPMRMDWADFGGTETDVLYDQLRPTGGALYSIAAAPQPADQAQYTNGSLSVASPVAYTRDNAGFSRMTVELSKPHQPLNPSTDSKAFLFNSYPQTGLSTASTATFETFVDEKYRYVSTAAFPPPTATLIPGFFNDYNSGTVLVASGPDLQVIGGRLFYPQTNYGAAGFFPVGQPNYAAVLAADPANHIRAYIRAFNTGLARNTGKVRLRNLAASAFESTGPFTGDPVIDHPGGAIVEVKVPGVTGWLDLGRAKGDPDLLTTDGHGCQVALEVSGSDVIVTYDTTSMTGDNGVGEFPLFFRVRYIKGAGTALRLSEVEWLPPV